MAANIASVKIEGRQRSPAYVSQWRKSGVRLSTVVKADPQTSYRKARGWRRSGRCPKARRPPLARITVNGSEKSNEIFLRASSCGTGQKRRWKILSAGRHQQRRRGFILVKRYAASAGQPKLATGWRWQNRSPEVASRLCLSTLALVQASSELGELETLC